MATIVKRGDSWRAQIRRPGFKTLSATFSRKVLAEKWVRERESELDQGRFVKDDPDFGVLVQRYIDEVIPLRPMQRTHVATLRTLRRQVAGVALSGVTPGWMLAFAESRNVAASTRGQEFVFLAMVLKHAETFWDVRPDMDAWRRPPVVSNSVSLDCSLTACADFTCIGVRSVSSGDNDSGCPRSFFVSPSRRAAGATQTGRSHSDAAWSPRSSAVFDATGRRDPADRGKEAPGMARVSRAPGCVVNYQLNPRPQLGPGPSRRGTSAGSCCPR